MLSAELLMDSANVVICRLQQNMMVGRTIKQVRPMYTFNWTAQQYFGIRNDQQKEIFVTFVNQDRFIMGATWMADKIFVLILRILLQNLQIRQMFAWQTKLQKIFRVVQNTLTEQVISMIQSYSDYLVAGVLIVMALVFIVVIIVFNEFREQQNKRKKKLTIPKQAELEKVHFEIVSANESSQ